MVSARLPDIGDSMCGRYTGQIGRTNPGRPYYLIRNRHLTAVKLGECSTKLLMISLGEIIEITDGHRFAQEHRVVTIGAPVNARQYTVAKGDVVCELVQLATDGDLFCV